VHAITERLNAVAPRGVDHNRRISMIAQFRNRALRMLKEHKDKFDYVWVMDFDMLPWKAETIATAFRKSLPDWDMVCANGVMSDWDLRYYDAFAYRSAAFPKSLNDLPQGKYFGLKGYVMSVMKGAARSVDSDPSPVDSCFGGMALYRGHLFDDCKYESNDGDCEHVHLHQCMKKHNPKASFNMLPSMKLVYDLDQAELAGYGVNMGNRAHKA